MRKWSEEQAWDWYKKQPWLCGCNFMGSDCCNRIEQWQELDFEAHLQTADRELALAASIGFNTVRLILEYTVWKEEHDTFMRRLDQYLSTCAKHGIAALIVFGNDCTVPKEIYSEPKLGPQTYDIGYHGGKKKSPHAIRSSVGYNPMDDPETEAGYYRMAGEIIEKYAKDPRVVIWDLFNEPGNGNRGSKSLPYMERFFEIAREISPVQPLTAGVWKDCSSGVKSEIEVRALELSDIVSYHGYSDFESEILKINHLKQYNRPIVNTEWLNRITKNEVAQMLPVFFLERIGCYCWGFVAGKYQTNEPWESLWQMYENGNHSLDLTKWQHELFRINLRPYDPAEIEVFKKFTAAANGKPASR